MNHTRRKALRAAGVTLFLGSAGCTANDRTSTAKSGTNPTGTSSPEPTTAEAESRTNTGASPAGGDATEAPTATPTETPTGTPTPTATEAPPDPVDVTIDNEGISAWAVVEDGSGSVARTDERNPTMTFEVGTRYVIGNRGWSAHPFALRRADDAPLLSQSADGRYEDDGAVAWRDDGDAIAFTVTDGLAGDLAYYVCTVHPSMRGDATVSE